MNALMDGFVHSNPAAVSVTGTVLTAIIVLLVFMGLGRRTRRSAFIPLSLSIGQWPVAVITMVW